MAGFGIAPMWMQRAVYAAGGARRKKTLVTIFQRGAADGLNIVVPFGEKEYYAARPSLAVPQPGQNNGALDLNGEYGVFDTTEFAIDENMMSSIENVVVHGGFDYTLHFAASVLTVDGSALGAGDHLSVTTESNLFETIGGAGDDILSGALFTDISLGGNDIVIGGLIVWFFRDPPREVPSEAGLIVSPADGTVAEVEELGHDEFIGGPAVRIGIFLSIFNVHLNRAPVAARVIGVRYRRGKFLNALGTDCAAHNENVLIGFESSEKQGEKISVRLIAGLIARRIIPFVKPGDTTSRGERMSLIQFGSRVEIHLPLSATVTVKLGDRVVGGETIVATRN